MVAAALVDTLVSLPRGRAALRTLGDRLRVERGTWRGGEEFVAAAANALYHGEIERAGARVLKDFRVGALGALALESAPRA